MHRGVQIVDLENSPKPVRKFFENLGDEPVIIERDGRAVYVVRPASVVVAASADRSRLAGDVLADVEGAWTDVPDGTLDAIASANRP